MPIFLAVTFLLAASATPALATPVERPLAEEATGITATEATLKGELNPGASTAEVEYHFTYNTAAAGSCEGFNAPEPFSLASGNHVKETQLITGLTPNENYSFCLLATSTGSEPETLSSVPPQTFKTAKLAPEIKSQAASGVTPFEAHLEALVNPNNESTTCTIEYGLTNAYGETVPCEQATLEGFGEQGVGVTVKPPLTPATTYHFRLVLENASAEKTEGADQEFTTLPAEKPTVESLAFSSVTVFRATLEGQVNPDFQATECHFHYGTSELALTESIPCQPETLEGNGLQAVTARPSNLAPATTYFYSLLAKNATGETEVKGPSSFETSPSVAATIEPQPATAVEQTSGTLNALVNPNLQEVTSCVFEYGATASYGQSVPCEPGGLGEGSEPVAQHAKLTGLTRGVVYHYRLKVENAAGPTEEPDQTFQTVGPPVLTVATAQGVTRTTVQLTGATVDPVGADVSFSFRYITQAGYEAGVLENPENPYAHAASSLPIGQLPAGYGPQPAPVATLSELAPGTTYHYALSATNSAGTTIGSDGTFTTLPGTPPSATTGGASGVGHHEATVSGTVDPAGLDTSWELQLGTEPGVYGPAAFGSVDAAAGPTAVSVSLSALPAGVTFHYRLVATSHDGVSYGADQSFTTAGFPSLTLPALAAPPLLAFTPLTPIAVSGPPVKPLTKAQKLAKALKACSHKRKSRRAACRRTAKRRYR
jgi:hypothetical protein